MTADIQASDVRTVLAAQDVGPGDFIATPHGVGIVQHAVLADHPVMLVLDGIYSVDVKCDADIATGDVIRLSASGDLSVLVVDATGPRAGVAWSGGECRDGVASVHLWLNG
jgi:predicted RecA/RadA family phage recombinase